MNIIYRYQLPPMADIQISMHRGSKIISTAWWKDDICVWAVEDTEEPLELRKFVVWPTGTEIPDGLMEMPEFVGTVLIPDRALIFHVFVEKV